MYTVSTNDSIVTSNVDARLRKMVILPRGPGERGSHTRKLKLCGFVLSPMSSQASSRVGRTMDDDHHMRRDGGNTRRDDVLGSS